MRYLLACLLLVLGMAVNAQKYIYFPANDTIKGDTTTFGLVKSVESAGSVVFMFTHTDVTDSLTVAKIEGAYTNTASTTWTALTGTAVLANTTTDGTATLYTSTPLLYLYYRGFLSCASGDTVAITNPMVLYKREKD